MKALSIRQPWAWLIIRPDLTALDMRQAALQDHGMKPVENRTWKTQYRGPLLVHAGQAMTRADYDACYLFLQSDDRLRHLCQALPRRDALERGGIVGRVDLVGCEQEHPSPFFCGPYGLVLANAQPRPFRPMKGALGFFDAPI